MPRTKTMTHHRVVVSRHGGPEVLQVVEEDVPEPQEGEVRVKVEAAGVSAYDLLQRRSGVLPGSPKVPFTPGEDIVGIVDELGAGVSTVEPGQRVAGWTFGLGGGYTESICVPVSHVVPVPPGVDSAKAVALVVNYLTASLALHQTALMRSGERMLVHGAAGGVGTALLQLGRRGGLEMYGTASKYNHALVSELGTTPIDYHTEDFVERIRDLTGDGVDAVFDLIGGSRQLWRSYRTLRKGGRLVMLGSVATSTGGMRAIPLSVLTVALIKLIPDGRRAPLSPSMVKYPQAHNDWYRNTLTDLLRSAVTGDITPVIAERIPLLEASRAHEQLEHGRHAGKVVLVTDA